MSLKKWSLTFIAFMILTGLLVGGFNILVDPFGVFGDSFFNWYAYDMTNNPRVSKIAYIDKHHSEFDSYIVGCSKTSSISTEKLNKYYHGAKFYNMIMYGGDMYDIEKTVSYLVDNYKVKNIIVNIGLEEGAGYHKSKADVKDTLHAKVTDASLIKFYAKYFFLNPQYSFEKLEKFTKRSYLPNANDIFDVKTGAYNKSIRDREAVGNLKEFIGRNSKAFGVHGDGEKFELNAMDESVAAIKRMKEHCQKKGISFILIASSVYYKEVETYHDNQLKEYWKKIADATEFWDFSGYNSIGFEQRYFYDAYHFRNSVGDMMLAYIFNDKNIYVPQDFGHKTSKENVAAHAEKIFGSSLPQPVNSYSTDVPILMYHHISENIQNTETTITPENFRAQMQALKEKGYTAILCRDLVEYVYHGKDLPENPIMITFDDGYTSVYQYAYPILKELGMKATVNLIGSSVGKDKYKETNQEIIPHFNYTAAREMYLSGVMDFQSHSYDMHTPQNLDKDGRKNALKKKEESETGYISYFKNDYMKSKEEMERNIGNQVYAYFYPYGKYSVLSEVLLRELDNKISASIDPGVATVIKGLPQSLYALKRINVVNSLTGKDLIDKIESYEK